MDGHCGQMFRLSTVVMVESSTVGRGAGVGVGAGAAADVVPCRLVVLLQ